MKYYTETIPVTLAEKLKEKGMPMRGWQGWATPYISVMERSPYNWLDDEMGILEPQMVERRYSIPTYGTCFDWLMSERDTEISFEHHFQSATIAGTMETSHEYYAAHISRQSGGFICCEFGDTWHEAANAAIEKALTLI